MTSSATYQGMRTLAVTMAIQALVSLVAMSGPVLAPTAAVDFGIPATYIGVFVGLIYLGAALATLTSGSLIRRYGPIGISQISLLACAAGLGLTVTGAVSLLTPSALLIGFGYGPVTPASSHILARTVPRRLMSLMFSLKQTGVPLGGALAGVVLPPILVAYGWRAAVGVADLACLLVIAMASSTRRELDHDADGSHPVSAQGRMESLRLVWSKPALRLLCISSFFFCMVQVSLSTYLMSYLTVERHTPLIVAGVLFSVVQIAGVVGRVVWGLFSDRWLGAASTLGLLGLAMSITCALTIEGAGVLPAGVVTGCFALYGATAIGWNGVFLAEVARQAPPESAGAATGGALAMTYLGAVIGPPLFGALASCLGSYGQSLIIVSVPAAMCGMTFLRARRAFDHASLA